MELLSPAGSLEKLRVAYRYGADAAYVGIHGFSLRTHADTIFPSSEDDDESAIGALGELKKSGNRRRRLYGALNLFAHPRDLRLLPDVLQRLARYPLDALIIADIGLIDVVRRYMPDVELHLSTQANCTNGEAARLYHRLGFSRIVPARELSLEEIADIRAAAPEVELEVFVHGAMCMSYSGRCFLSSATTGRSANRGDCAHTCRWHYALMEEKRPGEYYPIEEDGRFSTILSSRDLMLYDHVEKLAAAGIGAIKIEGRMKSALYTAITTSAYRCAVDRTDGPSGPQDRQWRDLLFALSHREYTTGFLLGDEKVHTPAGDPRKSSIRLMGIAGAPHDSIEGGVFFEAKNTVYTGGKFLMLLPRGSLHEVTVKDIFNPDGIRSGRAIQGTPAILQCAFSESVPPEDLEDAILIGRILAPTGGR